MMSSRNSPSRQPAPPVLAPDDEVITPSGSIATVMAVYANDGEALVVWSSGDRSRFKLSQLKPVRRAPAGEDQ